MTQSERLRRPVPERTKPNRGILGALGQAEGPHKADPPRDAHPLTPGFSETEPRAGISAETADYISDSVRAASDVVDEHIRQGQATAQTLGGGILKGLTGQAEGGHLLGSLTRAYSDLAAVWMEVAKTVAGQLGELKPAAAGQGASGQAASPNVASPHTTSPHATAPQAAPPHATPIALIIDSIGRAETRLDLFRPCAALVAQPLVAKGGDGVTQITDVTFSPGQGGQAGVLHVRVPETAAPGRYYAMLLNADDMSPAGALSLHLKGDGEDTG